jgi:hypothetical protein
VVATSTATTDEPATTAISLRRLVAAMGGRKKPETTEQERDHDYVMTQKRGYGEEVVGDEAKDLPDTGNAAKVARERETWKEDRERLSRQDF